jgi:hypothetical protein
MKKTHSWEVRKRAFAMWQNLGFLPWRKPKAPKSNKPARRSKGGDFYKGAFDNIPFLNDDAKRTFSHLLLRPGYMIRDYISGEHERYLAPLTALIIFYAFFALVSSVLEPVQQRNRDPFQLSTEYVLEEGIQPEKSEPFLQNVVNVVREGYIWLHLDEFPEEVDTQRESSLAALEATLRSQGIPLFLGEFIFLWLAMSVALRRYNLGMSACAAASAYVLCQFCIFMFLALVLSLGQKTELGVFLMGILLFIDYRQMLDIKKKPAFWLTVKTGLIYLCFSILFYILVGLVLLLISLARM